MQRRERNASVAALSGVLTERDLEGRVRRETHAPRRRVRAQTRRTRQGPCRCAFSAASRSSQSAPGRPSAPEIDTVRCATKRPALSRTSISDRAAGIEAVQIGALMPFSKNIGVGRDDEIVQAEEVREAAPCAVAGIGGVLLNHKTAAVADIRATARRRRIVAVPAGVAAPQGRVFSAVTKASMLPPAKLIDCRRAPRAVIVRASKSMVRRCARSPLAFDDANRGRAGEA